MPDAEDKHPGIGHIAHLMGADDRLPIDPDLGPEDPGRPSRDHRAGARVRRARPEVLAAILAGGFLGTLARYEVDVSWPTPTCHFPTETFVINTSGAFLLGLLLTVILERLGSARYRYVRPFAATGLLGGWTTYSTLVVEATTLGKGGDVATAGGYLAASLVCGVAAVALGITLGRTRTIGRVRPPGPRSQAEEATR